MKSIRPVLLAFLLLVLICPAVVTAQQPEREAVIMADGCSAFIVNGNLLVTAKHCEHPEQINVTIQDRSVIATRAFSSQSEDGPVVFRLQGGPYPSLPVSDHAPKIGDPIYSLGYPGGHWARIEGEIIGGNGVDLNYTNHRVATGNSGGPLLNAQGEVIGIALHVDSNIAVHQSGFAGWKVTTDAIANASGRKTAAPAGKSEVVVFSSPRCGPCRELKRDYTAGHFDEYDFRFVMYENGRWSDPDVYKEFWDTAQPKGDLTFPTIWVRGTPHYKVGYDARRRGGLLGWIRGVFKMLIGGLIGERKQPELPGPAPPQPKLEPAPEYQPLPEIESDSATKSNIENLVADLKELKSEALQTKADLEQFKEAGVIGRIKGIAVLKSDKKELMTKVEAVQNGVQTLKTEFQGNPVQMLWGLFGLVSGLVQRRFLGEGA